MLSASVLHRALLACAPVSVLAYLLAGPEAAWALSTVALVALGIIMLSARPAAAPVDELLGDQPRPDRAPARVTAAGPVSDAADMIARACDYSMDAEAREWAQSASRMLLDGNIEQGLEGLSHAAQLASHTPLSAKLLWQARELLVTGAVTQP